jgi:hypothetical protein
METTFNLFAFNKTDATGEHDQRRYGVPAWRLPSAVAWAVFRGFDTVLIDASDNPASSTRLVTNYPSPFVGQSDVRGCQEGGNEVVAGGRVAVRRAVRARRREPPNRAAHTRRCADGTAGADDLHSQPRPQVHHRPGDHERDPGVAACGERRLRALLGDGAVPARVPRTPQSPGRSVGGDVREPRPRQGALAYHDVEDAAPAITVYAGTGAYYGYDNSVSFTHELFELAADPYISAGNQGWPFDWVYLVAPDGSIDREPQAEGTFWAQEVCDPVEADSYLRKGGTGSGRWRSATS